LNLVKLGDIIPVGFSTADSGTGAVTNADATPVILLYEDGVVMGYSPVPTNLGTGRYQVQIDCSGANGFSADKQYRVDVTCAVGGVAGAETLAQIHVLNNHLDDVNTRIVLVQKLLRNKFITDPATGIATLYDDDGVTPLLTGQLYEDAAGTQTYRGQGAERRQRLA
jgi:hypothetical protein